MTRRLISALAASSHRTKRSSVAGSVNAFTPRSRTAHSTASTVTCGVGRLALISRYALSMETESSSSRRNRRSFSGSIWTMLTLLPRAA